MVKVQFVILSVLAPNKFFLLVLIFNDEIKEYIFSHVTTQIMYNIHIGSLTRVVQGGSNERLLCMFLLKSVEKSLIKTHSHLETSLINWSVPGRLELVQIL